MTNEQIANTIRDQIGHKALVMLCAQHLLAIDSGLQFKVRGSRKANTVRITLDEGTDLYRVEVMKVSFRDYDMRIKHTIDASLVGAENLCSLIEQGTGLRTSI